MSALPAHQPPPSLLGGGTWQGQGVPTRRVAAAAVGGVVAEGTAQQPPVSCRWTFMVAVTFPSVKDIRTYACRVVCARCRTQCLNRCMLTTQLTVDAVQCGCCQCGCCSHCGGRRTEAGTLVRDRLDPAVLPLAMHLALLMRLGGCRPSTALRTTAANALSPCGNYIFNLSDLAGRTLDAPARAFAVACTCKVPRAAVSPGPAPPGGTSSRPSAAGRPARSALGSASGAASSSSSFRCSLVSTYAGAPSGVPADITSHTSHRTLRPAAALSPQAATTIAKEGWGSIVPRGCSRSHTGGACARIRGRCWLCASPSVGRLCACAVVSGLDSCFGNPDDAVFCAILRITPSRFSSDLAAGGI